MTSTTKTLAVVSAALTLLLTGCGFGRFGDISDETRELLEISGASDEIPWTGLPDDMSLVVGKAEVNFEESPIELLRDFRMAVVIIGDNGEVVSDAFADVALDPPRSGEIGKWNKVMTVPKLPVEGFPELHNHFPALSTGALELTFKEHLRPAYYLMNPPSGTAFIWIESNFFELGSTITQIPFTLELDPIPGMVTREDIYIDKRVAAFELFREI